MRELKFRIWDGEKYRCVSSGIRWKQGSLFPGRDKWIIEQYTGLKDKNGKEIYEGDIIKFYHENFMVTWSNEDLRYTLSTHELIDYCFFNSTNCEIIGTIHENPELLEKF